MSQALSTTSQTSAKAAPVEEHAVAEPLPEEDLPALPLSEEEEEEGEEEKEKEEDKRLLPLHHPHHEYTYDCSFSVSARRQYSSSCGRVLRVKRHSDGCVAFVMRYETAMPMAVTGAVPSLSVTLFCAYRRALTVLPFTHRR